MKTHLTTEAWTSKGPFSNATGIKRVWVAHEYLGNKKAIEFVLTQKIRDCKNAQINVCSICSALGQKANSTNAQESQG